MVLYLEGAPVEDQPITIRIRDQTGEELSFRVKKTTKMAKIMDAYAAKKGIDKKFLRFTLDGTNVEEQDTLKMLELEEDDQIDVVLVQVGGGGEEEEGNIIIS